MMTARNTSTVEGGISCANVGDGCADNSRGRRQQRADQDYRISESAAQTAKHFAQRLQQILGDAGTLQHHPHEHEQRHCDQNVVRQHAPVAQGQGVEISQVEDAKKMPEQAEPETHSRQGERDGIAEHQRADHGDEHQDAQHFARERRLHHNASTGAVSCAGTSPRSP
jgi:hypothetical protein